MNIYNKLYHKAKNFLLENSKILHNYFWPTNVLYLHLYIDLYICIYLLIYGMFSCFKLFKEKFIFNEIYTDIFVISCFFICCPHSYRHTLHD